MVEIPDPLSRVLTQVDPEEIDQPRPPDEVAAFTSADPVPTESPCTRCGCHWIADPEIWVPKGHAECAYCRMWRGSVYRDAKLSEFENADAEGDGTEENSVEMLLTDGIPVYDAEALGIDDPDHRGVVADVIEND